MGSGCNFCERAFVSFYYREGFQVKFNLKEAIFWIFLVLSIILLIWNIFGNSPTEFITMITLLFTVLLKGMSMSDKTTRLEMKFNYLVRDFKQHIQHK